MGKGLRLFGHPLHAAMTHAPMGLLTTSLLWDVVGIWRGEAIWWAISFWVVAVGLAAAAAAATTGLVDYAAIEQGDPALDTGTRHMMFVLGALVPYGVSLFVRGGVGQPSSGKTMIAVLSLEALGLLLLSVGGWYGGHLVFHHGVGRDTVEAGREGQTGESGLSLDAPVASHVVASRDGRKNEVGEGVTK